MKMLAFYQGQVKIGYKLEYEESHMSKYIKVKMEDGSELYIETVETGKGLKSELEEYDDDNIPAMSVEKTAEKVVESTEVFGKVLPAVTGFAKGVAEQIRNGIQSDEMELEFSIALSGELTAAICSAGAETGFRVKLKWNKEDKKA